MIDFSKVISGANSSGRGFNPVFPYLRKDLSGDSFSYSFVLPKHIREKVFARYGDRIGVGYIMSSRQIIIASRDNKYLCSRAIVMSKSSGNSNIGTVSVGFMKSVIKNMYGDHKRIYFSMEEDVDGYIFTPNGQVDD